MIRRDKLGRRIGRNWWRELIVSSWSAADHAWWLHREAVAVGYATEEAEFAAEHPRPTLKAFMVTLAGTTSSAVAA
ncbi:hypothetical protein F9L07_19810 [Pimelobacter simplex]|uniref:Uncharacterized protein n=1 Tax=Nocardioides simplex TaxID=2045 RepID=A0A7J5DVD1_NOCSI|nr:hypothetical protein [Pimelobacter simplex]KAB2809288.1 hypothetical protein F9L07_19810 [Pimelobacter simplex]